MKEIKDAVEWRNVRAAQADEDNVDFLSVKDIEQLRKEAAHRDKALSTARTANTQHV